MNVFQLQHRRQPNMQPCRLYWEVEATEVGITLISSQVDSQYGVFHLVTDKLDKLTEAKVKFDSQVQKQTGSADGPTGLPCFSLTVILTKHELCGQCKFVLMWHITCFCSSPSLQMMKKCQ